MLTVNHRFQTVPQQCLIGTEIRSLAVWLCVPEPQQMALLQSLTGPYPVETCNFLQASFFNQLRHGNTYFGILYISLHASKNMNFGLVQF